MMIKLQEIELIEGVRVGHEIHVLHLQFVDDTIVLLEAENKTMIIFKRILEFFN